MACSKFSKTSFSGQLSVINNCSSNPYYNQPFNLAVNVQEELYLPSDQVSANVVVGPSICIASSNSDVNTCDESNQFDTWRYNYINLPNTAGYGMGTLSVKVPFMAGQAIVTTPGQNINYFLNFNKMVITPVDALFYNLTVVNCSSSTVQFSTLDLNNDLLYIAFNSCTNGIEFVELSTCNSNNHILCDWTVDNFKEIVVES